MPGRPRLAPSQPALMTPAAPSVTPGNGPHPDPGATSVALEADSSGKKFRIRAKRPAPAIYQEPATKFVRSSAPHQDVVVPFASVAPDAMEVNMVEVHNVCEIPAEPVKVETADFSNEDRHASRWKELSTLEGFDTYDITTDGEGALDCTWVEKVKNGQLDNRLTVRGFKQVIKASDLFFAPTGAESSFRLFLLLASKFGLDIEFLDVGRAFLHAKIEEGLIIKVIPPDEWREVHGWDKFWILKNWLYGLKGAPKGFGEWADTALLAKEGFKPLTADPCLFFHPEKQAFCFKHMDDFAIAAKPAEINSIYERWSAQCILKRSGTLKSGKWYEFLGILVCKTAQGFRLKNKPDMLVKIRKALELTGNVKIAATPRVKLPVEADDDVLLSPQDHSVYRTGMGLLTWFCRLRPDMLYALKCCSHFLAAPTKLAMKMLKHLSRYAIGSPDVELCIEPEPGWSWKLRTQVDSNWGNCEFTRNSTTGCLVRLFGVALTFRCVTQAVPASSSAEAELYGLGTGGSETLGISACLQELKEANVIEDVPVPDVESDSSAGIAAAKRQGLGGRLKHVDTRYMQIQSWIKLRRLAVTKSPETKILLTF